MTPPRTSTATSDSLAASLEAPEAGPRPHGDTKAAGQRNPVDKAFRILAWAVEQEKQTWGVREMAREFGMAPSTAYRALLALEAADVLSFDPETTQFRLSLEFFRLASRVAAEVPIRRAAMPRLVELVEVTGETAYLGVYDPRRRKLMYVDVVHSPHPVQYTMACYEWLDLYAGAGALGILPFLPEWEIDEVLGAAELKPLTPDTITEPDKLRNELETIRQNGYVVSVGQRIVDAVGVGAPIFRPGGVVIGDVVLAIPASRFSQRKAATLGRHAAQAAAAISSDIGGEAP